MYGQHGRVPVSRPQAGMRSVVGGGDVVNERFVRDPRGDPLDRGPNGWIVDFNAGDDDEDPGSFLRAVVQRLGAAHRLGRGDAVGVLEVAEHTRADTETG